MGACHISYNMRPHDLPDMSALGAYISAGKSLLPMLATAPPLSVAPGRNLGGLQVRPVPASPALEWVFSFLGLKFNYPTLHGIYLNPLWL